MGTGAEGAASRGGLYGRLNTGALTHVYPNIPRPTPLPVSSELAMGSQPTLSQQHWGAGPALRWPLHLLHPPCAASPLCCLSSLNSDPWATVTSDKCVGRKGRRDAEPVWNVCTAEKSLLGSIESSLLTWRFQESIKETRREDGSTATLTAGQPANQQCPAQAAGSWALNRSRSC